VTDSRCVFSRTAETYHIVRVSTRPFRWIRDRYREAVESPHPLAAAERHILAPLG
jgi:hypothetical protein